MKINFKRITAVASTLLLAGSTIGLAAAANYPGPFVSGSTANVAIVYGTGSGVSALDEAAAATISGDLSNELGGSGGSSTVVGGDSVKLAKKTNKFNLGEATDDFMTSIDDDDLSVVLADGLFSDDGNDEYDYEQDIVMENLMLTHFQDSDFNDDKPVLGFELSDGTKVLNYTLDFTPDDAESSTADWNEFEGATIEMLGKDYYILSATNDTAGSEGLTLLDSANSATVQEGESVTVSTSGSSYDVSVSYIDADEVRLVVNGETTPSLNEDDTYKLDSGDYIGIKDIGYQGVTGGIGLVEFSIGSGKIELVDGEEVQINGEDISDTYDHVLTSYVIASNKKLDKIAIEWKVDKDMWLGFDTDSESIQMPAFGNVQLSLGNFVTDAAEVTTVKPDGNTRYELMTTVTDGDVNFNFLYTNATNIIGIGKDSDELLETTEGDYINWTDNSKWFVASWVNGDDFESYVLEVSKIDGSASGNTTTIRSVATGSDKAINLDVGDTDEIGEISFTLDYADGDGEKRANITVAPASSGSINLSQVITAEGLKIQLPYDSVYTADGAINLTGSQTNGSGDAEPTTHKMNFTEEDEDGNVAGGEHFHITLGLNSGETTVSSIMETTMSGAQDFETTDSSEDYVGYINSSLATMTMFDTGGDQDFVDITYHGTEAYAEVFLSETGVTISAEDGGALGSVIFKDTETSSYSSKNVIVVGGSCINSAAAALVGDAYCGSDWTDATGVGSGQFLIKGYSNPDITSGMALLVAGYEAGDTTNAATYLTTKTVDTSKEYVGTSATSAEVVEAEA